jgi:RHS repeat-associated protein
VNLGNLNVHFSIPVLHKAGRGTSFAYDLSYDSSVWYPVGVSGSQTWTPVTTWGWRGITEAAAGYVTYTQGQTKCFDDTGGWYWGQRLGSYAYHDPSGTVHHFSISYNSCIGDPVTAAASDGSGYTMTAEGVSAIVYPTSGGSISPPSQTPTGTGRVADRNGNFFTSSVAGNTTFTDTLGTTVLTVSGSGTPASPMQYTYTSPATTPASVVTHYSNYTVKTNFGCSGIGEYGPSTISLASDVTLPDGSQYLFTYEATPGDATKVTGRVKQVTLPTGGSIMYTYSSGSNGVTCVDGTTAGLTRSLSPGGNWTYTRTNVSGSQWKTTITDPTTPTSNQTVVNFQKDAAAGSSDFYETERQIYQGAATGTPLETLYVCYDTVGTPTPSSCPTTAVTSPIARKTVFTYLPDSTGKEAERDTLYNSYGLVTEVDEYDFGNSTVGALIRKTVTSYSSLGNHIVGNPSSVIVKDGSDNVVAQTNYTYDEGTVTTTTGTPQHSAVSGSRGNLTTIATQVNATQTLYRKFTYFDTGNLNTSTDVSLSSTTSGATTTYVYASGTPSCSNSFPTQVNRPLGLSRSMAWNCTGGAHTSATDENGNTVSTAYSDPYFWRPASATDQLLNTASITYLSTTAAESAFPFNGTTSTVDSRTKVDGLGRPIVSQRRQGPIASNYDSVETDYDVAGHVLKTVRAFAASPGSLCSGTCPGTTYAYDGLNRPTTITNAGGGNVTYSYTKNAMLQTIGPAPSGENTKRKQLEYDGLGRLISVCEVTNASGSGACPNALTGYLTTYTYDPLGHLTRVTQNAQAAAGSQQTRTFAYDRLGRMTSETNPENGTKNYVYDSDSTMCGNGASTQAGNLLKTTDAAGNCVMYYYDALNRVTDIGNNNQNISHCKRFRYDNSSGYPGSTKPAGLTNTLGRLIEAATDYCYGANDSILTDEWFSYSKRGEVTDVYELTPHSSGYYHVTQSYWEHGGLKALSGLPGLPTITYGAADGTGLDGKGRVTKITASSGVNPLTGATYVLSGTSQPIGAITQLTLGSADTDNFSYNPNTGRMTQYKFNIGATPQSVIGNLTWNANGSLGTLAITDPFNATNAQTCNFTHDDLGRQLTANCGVAWNQSFLFDPFGNISKSATVGISFQATYAAATNRMTLIGSLVPTYDANGNLTNDTSHAYTWDVEGKMLTVDYGTASGVCDTYDALGRMVEKATGTTCTTSYTEIVYAPSGFRLATMTGQTLQQASVPLLGGAEAVYNSSGLLAYRHSDHLGSSRFASTPARTKYYDVAYAPYGEDYAGSGTADLSFTGQKKDTAAWLYDFMFRKYHPGHGRWMSPDPAGIHSVNLRTPQTWNRYAYVSNSPLGNVDPTGLLEEATCKTDMDVGCGGGGYDPGGGIEVPGEIVDVTDTIPEDISTNPSDIDAFFAGDGSSSSDGAGGGPGGSPSAPGGHASSPAAAKNCAKGLKQAHANSAAVDRANDIWDTIQAASDANNIDPAFLAAIGIRETGFQNIAQYGGGKGRGIWQIDLGRHPDVTPAQAFDPSWAANWAARLLDSNMDVLAAAHPNLNPTQLLQATAASYNFGTGNISGNPNTIDAGTTENNYGSNVLLLMDCF